jgi:hypothetical protein
MPRQTTFKNWDQRTADGMIAANDAVTGLPAYLGVKFVDFTPGRLVATMTIRDELLTPFKTLHGGVMAGLVDHVLGCVLYPLMPAGGGPRRPSSSSTTSPRSSAARSCGPSRRSSRSAGGPPSCRSRSRTGISSSASPRGRSS